MRNLLEFSAGDVRMADWFQPLWDLFTPKGALQEQLQDGDPASPTYSAFGRYNKTFKYKTKFPESIEPSNVGHNQPTTAVGLNQEQIDQSTQMTTQTHDPRTQNDTAVSYKLQNMNVQPTSPTNSNYNGYIAMIGLFFVALVFINLLRRKK